MELDELKEEWGRSEEGLHVFSSSQLERHSMIDRLIRTQKLEFAKVTGISFGLLLLGAVFLVPSPTESYYPTLTACVASVALTIPIFLLFRKCIQTIKSLDVAETVVDSLRDHEYRIQSTLKIYRIVLMLVIAGLVAFAFIAPSVLPNGFEVASAVGIYTLVLLGYSYRNMEGHLRKEVTKLIDQMNRTIH